MEPTPLPPRLSCLILAGGLGTRLRSVVSDVPKPLASVAGRPFLEIPVAQARSAHALDVTLCVGYLADQIQAHFGDGADFDIPIQYSHEHELRGTGGALKLAENNISSEEVWILNGDSYCGVDFAGMYAFHRANNALITLAAPWVTDRSRFGSLLLGDDQAVLGFGEKGDFGPGLINGGIYLMRRSVIESIPADRIVSLERDVFPALCGQGLYAFSSRCDFIDIGLPEEWHRAQNLGFLREPGRQDAPAMPS
jgi:NDP-sugar pyrophosphorylase family protein